MKGGSFRRIRVEGTEVGSTLAKGAEIDLASIKDLIDNPRTFIQEKIVSNINYSNGYINLNNDPDEVLSVSIAGGTSQYGSFDPDDVSADPDYYIDLSFGAPRLVWNRTWGSPKVFPLGQVINVGDKLIVIYNRKIV